MVSREGAVRKRSRLNAKGIPEMRNWRFTTLTIADRSQSPQVAYEDGKDRMRRFLAALRDLVGQDFLWVWKLEIHEDGFPHWHLAWGYTKKLPEWALERVGQLWGLGRCNTRRIRGKDMVYLWKYACKSVDYVPTWVQERKTLLRVVQTSRRFFTKMRATPPKRDAVAKEKTPRVVRSLAERERLAKSKALVVRYCDFTGKALAHFQVSLPCTYAEFRVGRVKRTHREVRPWVTVRGFILSEWEFCKLRSGLRCAA